MGSGAGADARSDSFMPADDLRMYPLRSAIFQIGGLISAHTYCPPQTYGTMCCSSQIAFLLWQPAFKMQKSFWEDCKYAPGSLAASLAGLPKAPSQLGAQLPIAARVNGMLLLPKCHSLGRHTLLKHARACVDITNSLRVKSQILHQKKLLARHAGHIFPLPSACRPLLSCVSLQDSIMREVYTATSVTVMHG